MDKMADLTNQDKENPFSQDILERIRMAPSEPGVYIMKDAEGHILYVGKSRNLRDRIRSYFTTRTGRGNRIAMMVTKIRNIDTIVTQTEVDALILENGLIKKHRPKYNVLLRDDKTYPLLKFTWQESFPRLSVVRRTQNDGALYFGPFVSPGALKDTLKLIARTFPLASCEIPLDGSLERPCVEYQIQRCLGPCAGLVPIADYRKVANEVRLFLEGKNDDLLSALHQEMTTLAKDLNFEEAAKIRDRFINVSMIQEKQGISFDIQHSVDVVAVVRDPPFVLVEILQLRGGNISGKREIEIKNGEEALDSELIGAFFDQYYGKDLSTVPDEILIGSPILEEELMSLSWLTEKKGGKVRIHHPLRGYRKTLLDLSIKNGQEALIELKKQKGAFKEALSELAGILGLESPPSLMACVDISNIGDAFPVATYVTFRDGKPERSGYRKFRIQLEKGQDDFKMLAHVMERQFRENPLPDLLVIDGGPGQLGACIEKLEEMSIHMTSRRVVSIAKERFRTGKLERIFIPGVENPVVLPPHSKATHILVHMRDEAHRFAITYHRSLRENILRESRLLKIPGIGPEREKKLLKEFHSIKAIMAAPVEEIMRVAGVSKNVAQAILELGNP
jgi:excinuclease ABC subunit C